MSILLYQNKVIDRLIQVVINMPCLPKFAFLDVPQIVHYEKGN